MFPSTRIQTSAIALALLALSALCSAQQSGAIGEPLELTTVSPPKGYLHRSYEFQLEARGGIAPLDWEITAGVLPRGMKLSSDGRVTGSPIETGDFRIRVTVTDSGRPPQQKSKELVVSVVAPLMLEWSRYPQVVGRRVECAIKLSNETGDNFDLTVIALAVNEIGRATAVGYQHFVLPKNTAEMELSFGENLPPGLYELNVDAVAEIPDANTIHRARLVTSDKLHIQEAP